MRRGLTLALWAAIGIAVLTGTTHLRQRLIEHQQSVATPTAPLDPAPVVTWGEFTAVPEKTLPPAFSPVPQLQQEPPPPAIAIIIDDLGNQWLQSKRTLDLPGDITLAILPFSPFSQRLAELAEQQGREVILHAPMEPLAHPAWRDGLRRNMSEKEMRSALAQMLDALPTVRGVNNHMGSALTQEVTPMNWIMSELGQRDLYFIDSRTSPSSQALKSARRSAIPSARRDVFLDNVRNPQAIGRQFNTLIRLAHQRGYAIAIGHPYPETLAFLEQKLAELNELGVQLVPASHLLDRPAMIDTAATRYRHESSTSLSIETHRRAPTAPSKSI